MKEFDKLLDTVRILRSPQGCPWDRAQNIDNMKKYLLEEVYELIDGIDDANVETIKEELGDIFLILVVITEMLKRKKRVSIEKVLDAVSSKLISRHPHVFSSKKLRTKESILKFWIQEKAKKKKRRSIRDRLPISAPALLLAGIFFKECANINGKRPKKNTQSELSSVIEDNFRLLKEKRDKQMFFANLIFDVCALAHSCGIDLEHTFRQSVFKKAENVLYRRNKKRVDN